MTPKQIEEPKDLKVKIGTPEEVFWTEIKGKCTAAIEQMKHEIVIQEGILTLAEEKIKEEKRNI